MGQLPKKMDPRVLVGLETSDDGAVYQLTPDLAIIQTVDFFTPVVDDPYTFGEIAAANSLSDIYAMGGTPILALNIVGFPNCLSTQVLEKILQGGAAKVLEAGASLVGGHSVEDDEPKYGLCVTGTVHPDHILTNKNAKPGDRLILTKPLGTGVLNTAIKAEMLGESDYQEAVSVMTLLNKSALDAARGGAINACTDITGFGLFGHAIEMAEGSGVTIRLKMSAIPFISAAIDNARMGLIPGGMYRNRDYFGSRVKVTGIVDEALLDLCYDPQTSGGLLLAIPESDVSRALESLEKTQPCAFAEIGSVGEAASYAIEISE
ncbi:selenophosphate synthase [Anoxynatronum buryatiense]|uniref:Selenide, water dikinase n=1 Tax=Anoxynatronum buryatiense TaxID=489973 RepID=A0AA45WV33_9CLOT|nr:selenophosphate synthase [Anoxynatronum buryatiense]